MYLLSQLWCSIFVTQKFILNKIWSRQKCVMSHYLISSKNCHIYPQYKLVNSSTRVPVIIKKIMNYISLLPLWICVPVTLCFMQINSIWFNEINNMNTVYFFYSLLFLELNSLLNHLLSNWKSLGRGGTFFSLKNTNSYTMCSCEVY